MARGTSKDLQPLGPERGAMTGLRFQPNPPENKPESCTHLLRPRGQTGGSAVSGLKSHFFPQWLLKWMVNLWSNWLVSLGTTYEKPGLNGVQKASSTDAQNSLLWRTSHHQLRKRHKAYYFLDGRSRGSARGLRQARLGPRIVIVHGQCRAAKAPPLLGGASNLLFTAADLSNGLSL